MVSGGVVDQAAGHDGAVGGAQVDRVAGLENAFGLGDARGQQGGVAADDGFHRTVVQVEPAVRDGHVGQPQQPGAGTPAGGGEVGADRLAGQGGGAVGGAGHHGGDAGAGGDAGRFDLGGHTAGADAGAAADPDAVQIGRTAYLGDPAGAGLTRVGVIQAVDVGEQDQRVGPGDVGDQRGQPVVVAEADLVSGHRVVLVDDRQHMQLQQPVQGPLGVPVVGPPHQVVGRQQDLADAKLVPGERGRVPGDEQPLADRGGRLLSGQVAGTAGQAQRGDPGGDGPGRDQDQVGTGLDPQRAGIGQQRDALGVDGTVRGGQRG